MQIRIATTLPYHQFKEWSKENVKTRTTRSRTREGKRILRKLEVIPSFNEITQVYTSETFRKLHFFV
ncbi:hypothetical protein T07_6375 [Trichinella nelsoni]|uniref:Uncharacterized protein n=1 Tax=Trichinella nelsoni TaxID=6336 RepID=A0A0V0RSF5_9BILA|nr:hypothetical protein T07_6375 [Trichinella nelsoni]